MLRKFQFVKHRFWHLCLLYREKRPNGQWLMGSGCFKAMDVCHRVKLPQAATSYHIYAEEIAMAGLVPGCSVSTLCQQSGG